MITYMKAGTLLTRLKRFYINEEKGFPHDEIELFELAWDLAECLEDYSNCTGDDDMFELAQSLKAKHTLAEYVTQIDTGVNLLHRDVMNYARATDEEINEMLDSGDLVWYLIHRED